MLRFSPQYRHRPWGGEQLTTSIKRNVPSSQIGESWELAAFGDHQSVVSHAEGNSQSVPLGTLLSDLWLSGALDGQKKQNLEENFPFLLKWLASNKAMSVQVHPDEVDCFGNEEGGNTIPPKFPKALPKNEAWYIAEHRPNALLYLGHKKGLNEKVLRDSAAHGTLKQWLCEYRPKQGEMLSVPAGMLHSIGGGYLILEVQQPSDSTFRVFDWERTSDSDHLLKTKDTHLQHPRPRRELHLDQAAQVVHFSTTDTPKSSLTSVLGPRFAMQVLPKKSTVAANQLRVFVAVAGDAKLQHDAGIIHLNYGDVVVAQPQDGAVQVLQGEVLFVGESKAIA